MNKNKSIWIFGVVIVLVLIFLFALPRFNNPNREDLKRWKAADIDCLPAHTNANLHIHPELEIIVDGVQENISANLGIVRSCMAEIHTHDASGVIHVESVSSGKTFTLSQFFLAWDKPLEREGSNLEMTVDGAENRELGDLILKDKQKIILTYTKTSD